MTPVRNADISRRGRELFNPRISGVYDKNMTWKSNIDPLLSRSDKINCATNFMVFLPTPATRTYVLGASPRGAHQGHCDGRPNDVQRHQLRPGCLPPHSGTG